MEPTTNVCVAGNVHHGVTEGLVLDGPNEHLCIIRDCVVNGEPWPPAYPPIGKGT